jgi:predicted enzyme related to lactoylglutathione lyase
VAPHPVVYFEIVGPDGQRLQEFYEELFGWQTQGDAEYGQVDASQSGLNGGLGTADAGGYVTVYVAVPDLQTALDRATRLGGQTVLPPTRFGPTIEIAQFTDPAGHRVGLIKM